MLHDLHGRMNFCVTCLFTQKLSLCFKPFFMMNFFKMDLHMAICVLTHSHRIDTANSQYFEFVWAGKYFCTKLEFFRIFVSNSRIHCIRWMNYEITFFLLCFANVPAFVCISDILYHVTFSLAALLVYIKSILLCQ